MAGYGLDHYLGQSWWIDHSSVDAVIAFAVGSFADQHGGVATAFLAVDGGVDAVVEFTEGTSLAAVLSAVHSAARTIDKEHLGRLPRADKTLVTDRALLGVDVIRPALLDRVTEVDAFEVGLPQVLALGVATVGPLALARLQALQILAAGAVALDGSRRAAEFGAVVLPSGRRGVGQQDEEEPAEGQAG